jgi:hypothetical protein
MKYYSEEVSSDLRLAFEKKIFKWSYVSAKMFGCPCYKVKGKLFAFLVMGGLVLTKLSEKEREDLAKKYTTTFFQAGNKTVKDWIKLQFSTKSSLIILFL